MRFYRPCFNPLSTGHARRRAACTPQHNGFQSPIYGSRTMPLLPQLLLGFGFQSPIYGSRTIIAISSYLPLLCFNPLSTGHAPIMVSALGSAIDMFQSPIYGSRTRLRSRRPESSPRFQSPIYGSRTLDARPGLFRSGAFQSPIYGSRTW